MCTAPDKQTKQRTRAPHQKYLFLKSTPNIWVYFVFFHRALFRRLWWPRAARAKGSGQSKVDNLPSSLRARRPAPRAKRFKDSKNRGRASPVKVDTRNRALFSHLWWPRAARPKGSGQSKAACGDRYNCMTASATCVSRASLPLGARFHLTRCLRSTTHAARGARARRALVRVISNSVKAQASLAQASPVKGMGVYLTY